MRIGIVALVFLGALTACGNQPEGPPNKAKRAVSGTTAHSPSVAEQQEMERRNKAKIEEMKAAIKTLGERDYEAHLSFWKEISALAPANALYAQEVRRAQAQVQKHSYASPEDGASIEVLRPRKEAFGNVLVIDAIIRNDSLSHLKDFLIECESRGNSGTTTDVNRRSLYDIVEARTSRTFRDINMGLINNQAANTTCRVVSATVA